MSQGNYGNPNQFGLGFGRGQDQDQGHDTVNGYLRNPRSTMNPQRHGPTTQRPPQPIPRGNSPFGLPDRDIEGMSINQERSQNYNFYIHRPQPGSITINVNPVPDVRTTIAHFFERPFEQCHQQTPQNHAFGTNGLNAGHGQPQGVGATGNTPIRAASLHVFGQPGSFGASAFRANASVAEQGQGASLGNLPRFGQPAFGSYRRQENEPSIFESPSSQGAQSGRVSSSQDPIYDYPHSEDDIDDLHPFRSYYGKQN